MASHRFFDHTGDFGVDLEGESREALFAELAPALASLLMGEEGLIGERETRALRVEGLDASDLLVALGNELLFFFEAEAFLTARLSIEALSETSITAVAHGEPYDPERHGIARPIKAVTHHGAEVVDAGEGVRGRLVLDL